MQIYFLHHKCGTFDNYKSWKNITSYILNSLNIEYYFQKIRELETHLETAHHSNVDNS